jgi:hypothetical protein
VTFTDPYQYRVLATGFGTTRVEAADGTELSTNVTTEATGGAISVTFPKSAVGGTLAGAEVAILLLGQDGFNTGSVRPVTASAGGFTFGGGRDDNQDPNVIDMIAPDDQTQSEALSFTADEQATVGYRTVVPPVAPGAGQPGDLDGDGAFEDVDGDGSKTYNDVVALFENGDSPAVEASGAFDFNANGRFDFNDIVRLFEELS